MKDNRMKDKVEYKNEVTGKVYREEFEEIISGPGPGSSKVGGSGRIRIIWDDDAGEFLRHFDGHTVFMSKADFEATSRKDNQPIHYHKGFNLCAEHLTELNEKGWGAFFTVNELDESREPGRHRTKYMVSRMRAIFMDDDIPRVKVGERGEVVERLGPRDDFGLEPSLIVESSPGKFHYYWLIDGGIGKDEGNDISEDVLDSIKDEWTRVQIGLIRKYNGDKQARELNRVLRLPGSKHMKTWKGESGEEESGSGSGKRESGESGSGKSKRWIVRWTGCGRKYEWDHLKRRFPAVSADEMVMRDDGGFDYEASIDKISNTEMAEKIRSGEEFHGPLLNLSYQFRKDGVPDSTAIFMLRSMMNGCSDEVKMEMRWKERYDDIPRIVAGADGRVNEEESKEWGAEWDKQLDDIASGKFDETPEYELREGGWGEEFKNEDGEIVQGIGIPWPPGLLGGLAGEAYDMAMYQYREVAVVSAVGIVAGLAGRRFNVNGTGLNVYLTLIMETGMGKDSISKFIIKHLMEINEMGKGSSFIGPARFTGPKGVIRALQSSRSRVCVFSEAGLLLKSTAGDQSGLSRMLLGLYGCSGHGQYSGSEAYSKDEDSVPMLHAPALTIINEATPGTLLEAFKDTDALTRGEIPRQSVYRIQGGKPYMNMNCKESCSDVHLQRLSEIFHKAQEVQNEDGAFNVYKMEWDKEISKDVSDFGRRCVDEENEHRGKDDIRSIMWSRVWVKAARFAALATVYNRRAGTDGLIIKRDEWDWAKAMVEYEMAGVKQFFRGSEFNDPTDDLIRNVVGPKIAKLVRGGYAARAQQNDRKMVKERKFKALSIRQVLKNNVQINKLNDDPRRGYRHKKGIDKLLDRMVEHDYLAIAKDKPKIYRLTKEFMLLFEVD